MRTFLMITCYEHKAKPSTSASVQSWILGMYIYHLTIIVTVVWLMR
jgi:hypothetical protein